MLKPPHLGRVLAAICSSTAWSLLSWLGATAIALMLFLGTHHPEWLARAEVPLCVSVASLRERIFVDGRKRRAPVPRALAPWLCDSGGFIEVSTFGRWRTTAKEHVAFVRRVADEIGKVWIVSPQDWMCEPWVIKGGRQFIRGRWVTFPGTGLSVREHQVRTVENFLELRALAPHLPWMPVLQGWSQGEYLDCLELYDLRGVDLRAERVVGVGSICRRQGTLGASLTLNALAGEGLSLHGFGFKFDGLKSSHEDLVSCDSMAWSDAARFDAPIPGHTHQHCNNCMEYALQWRDDILARIGRDGEVS
jgi:hypothetical protein